MARPKKQTIEYFPHSVNHHKTIFVLENKYGNDGYAFWFKLLETLGSTNGMFYDCNNISEWEFMLAKTHLNNETVSNILDTLADLEAIDNELWYQNRIIWVQNLVDNVTDAFKRRTSDMPKRPLLHTETPINKDICTQKPIKSDESVNINRESKVKESKVKETKTYIPLKFIDDVVDKVKITQEQYDKLIGKFDKELVSKNIVALDNYITNGKGTKYKDHYRALNTWCAKEEVSGNNKQNTGTNSANNYDFSKYTG